jgi:hypothetical protein
LNTHLTSFALVVQSFYNYALVLILRWGFWKPFRIPTGVEKNLGPRRQAGLGDEKESLPAPPKRRNPGIRGEKLTPVVE